MDSQENTLNQGTIEEPQVEATVAETPAVENTSEAETKTYATKQEVLDRVKEIAHSDEAPQKNELDLLKTTFYKLHLAERDAQMKEYLAGGGDPEKYVLLPDEAEEAFKAEMQIIKEKRAKIFLAQEEEKQANLQKKLDIIEKIKAMATSPDEANKSYQEFKACSRNGKRLRPFLPTRPTSSGAAISST